MTKPAFCIVVHDVAPPTRAACERLLAAIEEIGDLPVCLLAVPAWHGQARDAVFEGWLQQRSLRGNEIVLHGHSHSVDGRPPKRRGLAARPHVEDLGQVEFERLDRAEASRRMSEGVRWFAALGLPLHGFVAPGWRMSQGGWEALLEQPFDYVCTLQCVYLLPRFLRIESRSQIFDARTAWRRATSLLWHLAPAPRLRKLPLLRLELHPQDADKPALRRALQRLVRRHLRTRTPGTLADLSARWRRTLERSAIETERDRRLEEAEARRNGASTGRGGGS